MRKENKMQEMVDWTNKQMDLSEAFNNAMKARKEFKENGGNLMKEYKNLWDVLRDNGEIAHIHELNEVVDQTILTSGALVDKYDAYIEIISDRENGEIIEILLKGENKGNINVDDGILEEYETSLQDRIDVFENQEESIQEKIDELNVAIEDEFKSEIHKLPVRVTTIETDCDEREFINGENCRIISFDIFNGALVLNIGLEPVDVIITKDMICCNDSIIVFKSIDDDGETFEMSITNIINSGLGIWHNYKNDVLYLSPLEWRGMSKLFV